ncbi:shikimate kinase [Neobacillus sp. OS1-32]|jgi:shikimate kinase|uniref:Shikimate kinase n=1 Tax=Neobacillus paridis TaxID=2803862 RepID=A0ABS1TTJ5_9BACI|nr:MULTISPECIES: shikimate kinase [Neobacillus]MBL4953576.1 shikimate kinase [Neobacillus paridis]WML32276.1 shikimate kinase [Neobacillus sp. OS1-32]
MNKEKSIVLIGFMGVGKTTVSKLLAEKLNRQFIDIDEEIEKEFKLPIPEIFQKFGEKTFRKREKELIYSMAEQHGKIISVGGGAFLQEDIKNICLSTCTVIFLTISFENWKDRLRLIQDSRPVLHGKTIKEMEELFNQRQAIYADHHVKITVDHKNPEEVVAEILQKVD